MTDDIIEGDYIPVDALLEFLEGEREVYWDEYASAQRKIELLERNGGETRGHRELGDRNGGAHDAILEVINFIKESNHATTNQ